MAVPIFVTPQEAEEAFYDAIERRDIDAMMHVWADDDRVVCIHPGAPRLEGREEVGESWRQIFQNGEALHFTLADEHYTQDSVLAIHLVRECIEVEGEPSGVMLATNIYQFLDGSWRMVLHHASPEPEWEEFGELEGPIVLH